MRLRFFAVLLSILCLPSLSAFAFDQWQQPTPEELKMTSDPAAPDAPAVYLFREETSDDKLHMHSMYVRIKILTEKGKSYADVEIPYENHNFSITNVEGRTIHSDGSVVPFTGAPYDKLLEKAGNNKVSAKVFSMPAVEVGSILEYRYKLRYDDNLVLSPSWVIQQPIYVHKGHYRFVPARDSVEIMTEHGSVNSGLIWWPNLPPGQEIKRVQDYYELNVHDIPAEPNENFMPPVQSLTYRAFFYYSAYRSQQEFWKSEGKFWSKHVDHFANPSSTIQSAVTQITAGADTQDKKLQKIYAAVMALENTDFTRKQTEQEKKANHIKDAKRAEDVWNQKRGDSDEIAMLFLAMVRAAGMKAYAMQVVNRTRNIFIPNLLSTGQLDDLVVAVVVDGKEKWFDPGSKFCGYGLMHWKHTSVGGLKQTEQGTDYTTISGGTNYTESQTKRVGTLTMDDSGEVAGLIRITMTGSEALKWRQRIALSDETEVKKDFENELNETLPDGLKATVKNFLGADAYDTVLMAVVDVSGRAGSATQTRLFFPLEIFEARHRSPFVDQPKRQSAIDLHYPYVMQDQILLKLPPTWTVESTPKTTVVPLEQLARMAIESKATGDTVTLSRGIVLGAFIYKPTEYAEVRDFFDKISAADQQQLILKRAQPAKAGQ